MFRSALAAALILAAAPVAAQQQNANAPAFDLRAFEKVTVPNSTAVRFNCVRAQVCGERAYVTIRLQQVQADPTLQAHQQRIDRLAASARQNTQTFRSVDITPSTESTLGSLKQFRAEARLTRTNNAVAYNIDGALASGRNVVTIVSASGDQAIARRNYENFLTIATVVLEQHVAATAPRPAAPAGGAAEAPAALGD